MTRQEAETEIGRYAVHTTKLSNGPGRWDSLKVDVLLDGKRVGGYTRSYPSLYDTFVPFVQGETVYALFSPHYTCTRLMRLPECQDVGGEAPHSGGFCPTGYLVPYDPERGLVAEWGLVSGCVWGDDSSWKVQYLDPSRAAEGILRRDARFGYLELPGRVSLKEAVDLRLYADEYQEIEFTVRRLYSLKLGRFAGEYGEYETEG